MYQRRELLSALLQSTFPRGGTTLEQVFDNAMGQNFNPRSREGNDVVFFVSIRHFINFNPRSLLFNHK